ncbi:BatD family protein [Spirosoma rhododendri]|uniref:BatD family protein n=1 Tax=Spirosoma rhododendri TaxID=2728024 RepID=UPI0020C3679E|nr:BatD family protein [Spirosoma rhododendri]
MFVLFFLCFTEVFAQQSDNLIAIELGPTNFSIERPYTISVTVRNSEDRPDIRFPDIPGLLKKGISTSVTSPEADGKVTVSQVITQIYQAKAPGRYVVAPFTVSVGDNVARSEGAVLIVRPTAGASAPGSLSVTAAGPPPAGSAFLQLTSSKSQIYAGEGVALSLSFFIADNYPYALNFTALDRQIQQIANRIRPVNVWEENQNITELKPVAVSIGNRKFRQYRLYQAVFFPVAARPLAIPAVTLQLARPGNVAGAPAYVAFTSKPLTIDVRALPRSGGQVPVGRFQLEERLDRRRVPAGQSARFVFQIVGEGNIATLPAPVTLPDSSGTDIFPPEEQQLINRDGNRITGRKSFSYFIVPHRNGVVSLANRFQWVYFDPQLARYDTLRPGLSLRVGGTPDSTDVAAAVESDELLTGSGKGTNLAAKSIYAGLKTQDSQQQPIDWAGLIRLLASSLIAVMLVGVIFIIVKK